MSKGTTCQGICLDLRVGQRKAGRQAEAGRASHALLGLLFQSRHRVGSGVISASLRSWGDKVLAPLCNRMFYIYTFSQSMGR
jgi:hypothetical protein